MATIEEKQKELDALQTDFDEYIVSARELEEELDAELTKCREYYTLCLQYVNICRVYGKSIRLCTALKKAIDRV